MYNYGLSKRLFIINDTNDDKLSQELPIVHNIYKDNLSEGLPVIDNTQLLLII